MYSRLHVCMYAIRVCYVRATNMYARGERLTRKVCTSNKLCGATTRATATIFHSATIGSTQYSKVELHAHQTLHDVAP